MVTREAKLAVLRREFGAKSEILYLRQVSKEEKRKLLADRVRIAADMRKIVLETSTRQPEVALAGSKDINFVKTMRQKGIIFRYVGDQS